MENNGNMINLDNRSEKFYSQLTVSERTKKNYKRSINSSFVKSVLKRFCNTDSLFEITDLEKLWEVYCYINLHPVNMGSHRVYSTAIMKYIRFLNHGEKYGKRIDYNKPKPRRKEEK